MWKGSVYVVNIPVRVFVYYIRVLVLYYMRVLVCQYVRVGKGSIYVVNIRVLLYYIRLLVYYIPVLLCYIRVLVCHMRVLLCYIRVLVCYIRVLVCQYVRVGKGSIYVVNIRFFISKYTRALALTFVNSNLMLVQGAEKSVRETLLCSKYSIYVVSILGQ